MSRHNILHVTEINAPMDFVWETLFDLEDWVHWNKWTLLSTKDGKNNNNSAKPTQGTEGQLRACYEGNDKDWKTFDFVFGEIIDADADQRLLTWQGTVAGGCLFSGHHTMRLKRINNNKTQLIHQETFGGILPVMGLGLPFETLNRNYRLMNEAFRNHVEQKQAKLQDTKL